MPSIPELCLLALEVLNSQKMRNLFNLLKRMQDQQVVIAREFLHVAKDPDTYFNHLLSAAIEAQGRDFSIATNEEDLRRIAQERITKAEGVLKRASQYAEQYDTLLSEAGADIILAETWLLEATEQDDPVAHLALILMYETLRVEVIASKRMQRSLVNVLTKKRHFTPLGHEVPFSMWLQSHLKPGETHLAVFQYLLGKMHKEGLGIKYDADIAYAYIFSAYKGDCVPAIVEMAQMYNRGYGDGLVVVNKDLAKKLSALAELKRPEIAWALACSYELGEGVPKNFFYAFDLWLKLAHQGYAPAKIKLKQYLLETGKGYASSNKTSKNVNKEELYQLLNSVKHQLLFLVRAHFDTRSLDFYSTLYHFLNENLKRLVDVIGSLPEMILEGTYRLRSKYAAQYRDIIEYPSTAITSIRHYPTFGGVWSFGHENVQIADALHDIFTIFDQIEQARKGIVNQAVFSLFQITRGNRDSDRETMSYNAQLSDAVVNQLPKWDKKMRKLCS